MGFQVLLNLKQQTAASQGIIDNCNLVLSNIQARNMIKDHPIALSEQTTLTIG